MLHLLVLLWMRLFLLLEKHREVEEGGSQLETELRDKDIVHHIRSAIDGTANATEIFATPSPGNAATRHAYDWRLLSASNAKHRVGHYRDF